MARNIGGTASRHTDGVSDSCRDGIYGVCDYLRSNTPEEYSLIKVDREIARILDEDHDPSETLADARRQCRYGRTVGTILFIYEELMILGADLTRMAALAHNKANLELQFSHILNAQQAAGECLNALKQQRFHQAGDQFHILRTSLQQFRGLLPANERTIEAQRIFHATALAADFREYSRGK